MFILTIGQLPGFLCLFYLFFFFLKLCYRYVHSEHWENRVPGPLALSVLPVETSPDSTTELNCEEI